MRINAMMKFAFVVTVAFTATTFAGTIKLYNGFGRQAGEFDVMVKNTSGLEELADSPIGLYSRTSKDPRDFAVFCVERDEFIDFGKEYNAKLNTQAIGGGKNTDKGDPISFQTAYLYNQFHTGKLSDYAYGNGDGKGDKNKEDARNASADSLQQLIWFFEQEYAVNDNKNGKDEESDYDYDPIGVNGSGRKLLVDFFGIGKNGKKDIIKDQMLKWYDEAVAANWTSLHGVRVLNLSVGSGDNEKKLQDQLCLIVPAPAAAMLAMLGLAAFISARRFA